MMISVWSFSRLTMNSQPAATASPTTTPPSASRTKLVTAAPALNVPLNVAATAKRNRTSPVASLSRLSPSTSADSRRGSLTFCSTARAETASGGETIAPSAKQAAQGRLGTSQCVTMPTAAVVKTIAPMASERMPGKCRRNRPNAVK